MFSPKSVYYDVPIGNEETLWRAVGGGGDGKEMQPFLGEVIPSDLMEKGDFLNCHFHRGHLQWYLQNKRKFDSWKGGIEGAPTQIALVLVHFLGLWSLSKRDIFHGEMIIRTPSSSSSSSFATIIHRVWEYFKVYSGCHHFLNGWGGIYSLSRVMDDNGAHRPSGGASSGEEEWRQQKIW